MVFLYILAEKSKSFIYVNGVKSLFLILQLFDRFKYAPTKGHGISSSPQKIKNKNLTPN
jgi:hypothetical protein